MSVIDITKLLSPVSDDAPCGVDIEYTANYLQAARLMEGSPDVQYGSMHLEAADPDWKAVKASTEKLFAQSHDLRLAVWLTRSLMALHGFAGLNDGLALIRGLLEQYWEQLHPQRDPEDGDDPTARINAVIALDDKSGLVRQAYNAALVDCHAGRFTLRDIDIAGGELSVPDDVEAPAMTDIDAAFSSSEFQTLADTAASIADAGDQMTRIDALLTERAGHQRVVGLTVLAQLLQRAQVVLQVRLQRHPGRTAAAAAAAAQEEGDGAADTAAPDHIGSRIDVVRTLDRLCDYYAGHEPASPVPLLLQRARRLVDMNFLEILSDLSPGSLGEIKHLAGIESS